MTVDIHPAAIADAREARAWYARHDAGLGNTFMSKLDHAVEQIAGAP